MKAPHTTDRETGATPPIHIEYIQNAADRQSEDGLVEIEAYHRALFLNHHGKELARYEQQRRVQEDRLRYLEERLDQTSAQLVSREKWIPVHEQENPDLRPKEPWNAWDIGMFVAALLSVIALLAFGVLNISFNLLESGIVTFLEHPARAYLWAALLPVGALAVKVGWDLLESGAPRTLYLWGCLTTGLVAALVWVAAYASVYPTLSQSAAEQIAGLSVFNDQADGGGVALGRVKTVDMVIVASQAIAEIFLSALLGIYMTTLYARHRPVRLAINPQFMQPDSERIQLEKQVADVRMALADATGSEQSLKNQLAAFTAFAKSRYQKEVVRRADEAYQKRVMLDQITERFRSQLESLAAGDSTRRRSTDMASDFEDVPLASNASRNGYT